jgi:hypothetical protein
MYTVAERHSSAYTYDTTHTMAHCTLHHEYKLPQILSHYSEQQVDLIECREHGGSSLVGVRSSQENAAFTIILGINACVVVHSTVTVSLCNT